MNPHYNQQQPYYNYQQHIPGPPQPAWQAPAPAPPQPSSGWHDPRFQNVAPPPPPQSPPYGHNNFGSATNQSQYPPPPAQPTMGGPGAFAQPSYRPQDNYQGQGVPPHGPGQWGVKYNQGQYNQYQPDPQQTLQPEQRPALPPRPVSSMSQTSSLSSHHYAPSVSSISQPANPNQPQGSWGAPSVYSHDSKPPTPPPRPTAYAASPNYGPAGPSHEQYSHQTLTHHYDPLPQPQPKWQQQQQQQQQSQPPQTAPIMSATLGYSHQASEGPVSPMDEERRRDSLLNRPPNRFVDAEPPSQNVQLPAFGPSRSSTKMSTPVQTGSTSWGFFGGPSDWQHYDPSAVADEQETPPQSKPEPNVAPPLQPSHSIKRKSVDRTRPPSKASTQQPLQPPQETVEHEPVQPPEMETRASAQRPFSVPHAPERHDSAQSAVSSISGIDRNDTIDNVIQAWSAPITTDTSNQSSPPPTRTISQREQKPILLKSRTHDREAQTDFKPQIETRVETKIETKEVQVDPYADIQDQYKSTLTRFANMLRQEIAAESDEEKFKVFQGFVIRELRLRSVLYGIEAHSHETSTRPGQDQLKQTPAPPLPQSSEPQTQREQSQSEQTQAPPAASIEPQSKMLERTVTPVTSPPPQRPALEVQTPVSSKSRDDSFVVVHRNESEDEYSPGGRPRITPLKLKTNSSEVKRKTLPAANITSPTANPREKGRVSPSLNAPMTLDDYVMPDQPSPSADAPIVVGSDTLIAAGNTQLAGPINFQPSRPLYQPFRYSEGPDEPVSAIQVQSPPAESFAALRQTQAAESGRTLVHDIPPAGASTVPNRGHSKTPSSGRREHEEAFIGLIRAKSQAIRNKAGLTPRSESPAILRAGTPMNRSTPSPAPVLPIVKSVQALRSLVPSSLPPHPGPKTVPHPKLEPLDTAMNKMTDDFSFIHARVLSWDKRYRQLRAKQESERQARQSKNEERIDHLFNDNQIGYADIAELEKDFKLEEAGKKYKEDEEELKSFTEEVFDWVVTRLDSEIRELTQLRTKAVDMLDLESNSAAKQIQATTASGVSSHAPISSIMRLLLQFHEKLEMRHVRIAEANFEREKRRKHLELSVLFTNSDKSGIKRLEGEFAKAERIQILEEGRRKTERANRLLDSFDRVVVRGLAENQGVVDDVHSRLQSIRDLMVNPNNEMPPGQAKEDLLYGPEGIRDLVERTSALIDHVHNDSKALVELLDKADTLSNNADFEMYMAEAKLAEASLEKFEKLKVEKEMEDRNVNGELQSRLSGVSRVPDEISALIKEVRDKIGGDAGHQERINKALEAAKLRNEGASTPG